MSEQKIRVGISHGDVNGIGLEVIIKTFLDPQIVELCTPVVFSSLKTASYHRKALGQENFSFNPVKDLDTLNSKRVNLINCYEEEINIDLGKANAAVGKYALMSLEAASDALLQKKIDVLVTAPIDKHSIQSDTFNFPGHTDYLDKKFGGNDNALMLLAADELRIAVVTGHTPLANVASQLTQEKILKKIKALAHSLLQDFSIRKPKIAVLGLNPHAGDKGTIGKEELEIIIPAINKAKEENVLVYGPYSADGFFGSDTYKQFDAVLAMYHDQGLIPFKALCFDTGVNYTAGLSIVRTSPDHGTAYEIAGKNLASETSFRNAVYLACDIFKNRSIHSDISAHPLKTSLTRRE